MTHDDNTGNFDSTIEQYFNSDNGINRLADVFRFISFVSGESYGPHSHLRIEINYVKRGSCRLLLDHGEIMTFAEGEIMIITPEVKHRFEAGADGATLMQLEFRPEIFKAIGSSGIVFDRQTDIDSIFGNCNGVIKIVDNVRIMRIVQQIVTELEEKAIDYQALVIMHYAELMIMLNRHIHDSKLFLDSNSALHKSVAYIRTHYQDDISISQLALLCGVSSRHLRALFALHLGKSPLQYLNQLRIARAIELINNSNLSIKEVCFRCGFHSPQYFSRIFKQITGRNPHKTL
ncbi:MAG: AraC family transcriptional regulator [Muribaculaceae bacterium]